MLGSAVSPGRVTPGWPRVPTVLRNAAVSASVRPRGLGVSGEPQGAEELWLLGLALSLLSCSVPLSLLQLPWALGSPLALGQCWKCFWTALLSLLLSLLAGIALVGSLPLSLQFALGSSRSSLSSCCTARIAPPAPEGVTGCPCHPLLEPPQPCWKHLCSRIPIFPGVYLVELLSSSCT